MVTDLLPQDEVLLLAAGGDVAEAPEETCAVPEDVEGHPIRRLFFCFMSYKERYA